MPDAPTDITDVTDFISEYTWPSYLAKKLNVPLEHTIVAGQSNIAMLRNVIDEGMNLIKQGKKPFIAILLVSNIRTEIVKYNHFALLGPWCCKKPKNLISTMVDNLFSNTTTNNGLETEATAYYDYFFHETTAFAQLYMALLALQKFVKDYDIPYVLMNTNSNNIHAPCLTEVVKRGYNVDKDWTVENLYNLVDKDMLITKPLNNFAKEIEKATDMGYPKPTTHELWVDSYILPFMKKQGII